MRAMVVKTKFSKKKIEKILSNYDLGKLHSYRGFKSGCVQTSFLINTTKGKYALRYYDERNLKQISVETEFLLKLEKTNIPYTRIVKTKKGKPCLPYKKSAILITKFLEGDFKNKNKKTYAKQLGAVAGKIHKVSRYKAKNYKSKWILNHDFVKKLFESRNRSLKSKFKINHKQTLKEVIRRIKTIRSIKLPMGMNHGDLLHDDILFTGNKITGVLDFDDCAYGYLLADLAEILGFWCIDDKVHFNYMKEAVKAYNRYRKLSGKEISHIYYFVLMVLSIAMLYETYNEKYPNCKLFSFKLLKNLMKIDKEEFDKRLR
jgi:homoserine kinase type II